MRSLRNLTTAFALALMSAVAAPAGAAELNGIGEACGPLPVKPALVEQMALSPTGLAQAKAELNAYVVSAESHMQCLRRKARSGAGLDTATRTELAARMNRATYALDQAFLEYTALVRDFRQQGAGGDAQVAQLAR